VPQYRPLDSARLGDLADNGQTPQPRLLPDEAPTNGRTAVASSQDLRQRLWAAADELRANSRLQAEFLVHEFFPWHLVERIGVHDADVLSRVTKSLAGSEHPPTVAVERAYYY
jgi:hypothetical protein